MRHVPFLVLVIALGALGACDDGGGGSAGTPDAAPADAHAADAGAGAHAFIEDFLDESHVDPALTTATIDTGLAHATSPVIMLSTGDGSEGAVSLTAGGAYPAGTHNLTSFSASGMPVTIDGDTTLLVTGDFTVSGHADLTVNGSLTLVVGGTLSIDCAIIKAQGDVLVMHPDAATPIQLGCVGATPGEGTISTFLPGNTGVKSGDIEVDTRGAIELAHTGYFFSGRNNGGATGSVTVRAYGDISLDDNSYFIANDATAPGDNGVVTVMTEGSISLTLDSYFISGRGTLGGGNIVRAGGDLLIDGDSYILSANPSGSSLDVVVVGTVTLSNQGYLLLGAGPTLTPSIELTAGALTMTDGYIQISQGSTTSFGGPVSIHVAGAITASGSSYFAAGGGPCVPGGDLLIEAGGPISIGGDSSGTAGSSFAAGCGAAVAGGNVKIHSGSTVTLNSTSVPAFEVGTGASDGTSEILENAAVTVTPDAQLLTNQVVESTALPLDGPGAITTSMLTADPGVVLLVSPDGTAGAFAPIDTLVGTALTAAWRYRLELGARFFDGVTADRFEVDYE